MHTEHMTSIATQTHNDETPTEKAFWSSRVIQFGYCVQILYSVVGGTAIFVTIVNFVLLNHRFLFWNTSQHFVTSASMIFDSCFNSIVIYEKHLVFHLAWVLLYVIQAWALVTSHAIRHWPYFFLDTSSTSAFVWYVVLYVLDIIMYFLWMGINQLKVSLITGQWCCCCGSSSTTTKDFKSVSNEDTSLLATGVHDEENHI